MNKKANQEVRDWINKGICGLFPIYHEDGGNYTRLIFHHNSPMIVEKRIYTVLVRLAGFYQKDIRLIRQQAREITGQRSLNPLPINPNTILVPFKVRKPIGKDDGAMGYFSSSFIDDIREDEEGVWVFLRDGQGYRVLETLSTARHHMGIAHQIYFHLLRHNAEDGTGYDVCREPAGVYNSVYDQPATKGDMALVFKNIGRLAHILDKLQKR
ncbi:MAG TPA: hypothetical protein VFD89_00285 [Clostridia bacterium]|nr:hypothetical protein [Clostridia bacterium]